jgi:Putative prokaryotic signal transducing protein
MSNDEANRLAEHYARMADGELELVAEAAEELTDEARSALRAELEKRKLSFEVAVPPPPPPPSDGSDREQWSVLGRFANLTEAAKSKETLDAAGIECRLTSMVGMDWFIANLVGGVKLMVRQEDVYSAQEVLDDDVSNVEPDLQHWSMLRRFRDLPEATLAKGALDSAGIECHLTDDNMVRLDWFISNLIGGAKLVVKPDDLEAAQQILDQPTPAEIEYDESGPFNQPSCAKCGSFEVTYENAAKGVVLASLYVTAIPIPIESRRWHCSNCGAHWIEANKDEETSIS